MSSTEPRSYCPINLSLEIFGDAWTLLVLRDMMFAGKRHFREFLQSDIPLEGGCELRLGRFGELPVRFPGSSTPGRRTSRVVCEGVEH